jgi:ABC-type multidrug transport system permease subunit
MSDVTNGTMTRATRGDTGGTGTGAGAGSAVSERPPNQIVEMTLTRLRGFLREPEALFWVFAFPVLMALALGVAFRSQKPQEVQAGVLQVESAQGGAQGARETERLAQALRAAPGIRVRVLTAAESDGALRNGLVQVLVIPGAAAGGADAAGKAGTDGAAGGTDGVSGAGAPPTYRFDPTRPDNHVARLTVDNALQRAAGRQDAWTAHEEQVLTPGSRYIDWLLPGLLGMNIMGTGLWSVSFSVVWARTHKLLKRMVATPMSKTYYLLSHLLARLGFLVLEVALLLVFGYFVFGVTVHGSLWTVSWLCLLGAFSFTGLGLLLASRARTIEAVSGLMNVAMLPMWLLSGVFFASSNFPDAAQPFIKALPLTALNDALRAVMIEGTPLTGVLPQMGILSAWGLGTFGIAIRLFRWT